ncbi:hypothetical protein S83_065743, partial [Arachis hypogaea]
FFWLLLQAQPVLHRPLSPNGLFPHRARACAFANCLAIFAVSLAENTHFLSNDPTNLFYLSLSAVGCTTAGRATAGEPGTTSGSPSPSPSSSLLCSLAFSLPSAEAAASHRIPFSLVRH